MKKWLNKLEAMSMAVAFAEAGEWSFAKEIMEKQEKKSSITVKPHKMQDKRPRMRV